MAGRHPAHPPGGLGFDLKWNMGWMHDTLDYLAHDPVHRAVPPQQMTFSLDVRLHPSSSCCRLSHDEVVHGKGSLLRKMPGDRWQQLANLRAYFAFMWAHPGKQLLFMGRSSARTPSGPRGASSTGGSSTSPATRACCS